MIHEALREGLIEELLTGWIDINSIMLQSKKLCPQGYSTAAEYDCTLGLAKN
jgi:hypothetical protein